MISRIKTFFSRVQTMSIKAMFMMIDKIHEESSVSKFYIFIDMVWCAFRYGVGYLEYRVFGWVYIRGKKRMTFMRMQDNLAVARALNNREYLNLFEDKVEFNKRFSKFVKRDFVDLRISDFERFKEFCINKSIIFVKEIDGFGGVGAKKITLSEYKENAKMQELYDELKRDKLYLIEDCVVQCDKMNELCPSSINTIRMVTVLSKGQTHLIYSLVRMGDGTKPVDNISSGGMYAPVDEDGVIFKPAFCDKTGELYTVHPFTKINIEGFEIPFYKEAVQMVKEAAFEVPEVGYVGWDVAISEFGPLIIEGNPLPGYDMPQNYYHLRDNKIGILKKFEDLI